MTRGARHDPAITAEGDRLEDELVPTLDGKRLRPVRSGLGPRSFTTEDGEPVLASRERDIVFVNPRLDGPLPAWWGAADLGAPGERLFDEPARRVKVGGETFSEDDVASLLVQVASAFVPAAPAEMSPLSLHRLLVSWLSVDDGDSDEAPDSADDEVDLPWGFWKATLDEGAASTSAVVPEGAAAFTARVHWGEASEPRSYVYWLRRSGAGDVVGAGWLEMPPPVPDEARFSMTAEPSIDVAALFTSDAD